MDHFDKIIEQLILVNKKIHDIKNIEYVRKWIKNNPKRHKKKCAEWNLKNRKEYTKNYIRKK